MARENFSRKRKAILNALRETDAHPTAEWLYETLRPAYPDLSLGTVYRNLRFLCRKGEAVSVGVIGGHERFDAITAPHAHFVCDRCGSVRDIPKNFFGPDQLRVLSELTGFAFRSAGVMFRGLCRDCAAAEKQESGQ